MKGAVAVLLVVALAAAAAGLTSPPGDDGAASAAVVPSLPRLMSPAAAPGTHVFAPDQLALDQPPPTIQAGIGPGSALQQGDGGDIDYVCSASFLVRDRITFQYYLSTAGHCLVVDAEDPTPRSGHADPDDVDDRVDICFAGCINNALGLGDYLSLRPEGDYHPVAFAESGGVGQDFGLIALPASAHDLLRPEMPQWGGPSGLDGGNTGDILVHYGHGALCCPEVGAVVTRTPLDQGRIALSDGNDGHAFSGIGHVTGGDSGSGAAVGALDGAGIAHGLGAAGVITHGLIGAGTLFSGTVFSHGLEMAHEHLGLSLELVPEGDLLPALPPVQPHIAITTPAASGSNPPAGFIRVGGLAEVSDPGAVQVQVALDDPSFSEENLLPVDGVASWNATWFASKSGVHTLFARMVYAGQTLAQANETVAVGAAVKTTAPTAVSKTTSTSKAPTTKVGTTGAAPRTTTGTNGQRSTASSPTVAPSVTVDVPALGVLPLAAALAGLAFLRTRRR